LHHRITINNKIYNVEIQSIYVANEIVNAGLRSQESNQIGKRAHETLVPGKRKFYVD